MATSLYDLSVGSYLQTVGAIQGVLEKGLKHCESAGVDPESVVESRLAGDMLPFRFQVIAVAHHSLGAINALKTGLFGPPGAVGDLDYRGLMAHIAEALAGLKALTPAEVDACAGRDVLFKLPQFTIPFTAENFIMSFSLPNLHFHATTAYDILRAKGAPLGKRDYLGAMRIKT